MSKSTSPRAPARDWNALLEQAIEADRQLSAEELDLWRRGILDGTANGWNVDLLHALQRAIEGRDPARLLALLDAGLPVAGFMAPLVADVLRATQGTVAGRPKAFTAQEDRVNREMFARLTHPDMKMSARTAMEWLAGATGKSVDSIRRSLKRTG